MFRLIWIISIYVRSFMRRFMLRFMPSNIAITAFRTRNGLKWAAPAMLLSVPYLFAASCVATLVDGGASKWFYVIFLVCIWNALKIVANGFVCMGLLARVRVHERRLRRSAVEAPTVRANEQLVDV